MVTTPEPIKIEVSFPQFLNLQLIMYHLVLIKTVEK